MKAAKRDTLRAVPMNLIGPNPHRDLSRYPPEPERVEAIRQSIADVGWFPGNIVVRTAPNISLAQDQDHKFYYQQAYGHRRLEAARRYFQNDAQELLVVLRELSDEDMLKYMVRENLDEAPSRNFLMLLEIWEATQVFLSKTNRPASTVETASFMGWTRPVKHNGRMLLSNQAYGCSAAHELIERDMLKRADLEGLTLGQSIRFARQIHGRLRSINSMKLPEAESTRQLEALKQQAMAASRKLKELAIAKSDGAEASRELRLAAKGTKDLPDVWKALMQTRTLVQSWNIDDRIRQLCSISSELRQRDREMLQWLGKDLENVTVRCGEHLLTIRQAVGEFDAHAIDTIGHEIRSLPKEQTT